MALRMRRLIISISILIGACFISGVAQATTPPSVSYKGITLSPAIVNIELAPYQQKATFKIHIENNQTTAVSLTTASLDFKSLNETGGVAFIGANANQLQHKYGLANWLSFPAQALNLKPGQSQSVDVEVDNRTDLSPGGHYAAVLFNNAANSGAKNNKVSLNQVVATLVFLKKTGGESYALQLQDPKLSASYFNLPTNIGLRIKNIGNTQTVTRGTVYIYGPNGKIYEKGVINTDSGLVLPESTRYFRTPLTKTGHSWLPGKYRAVITYRAEDLQQAQTQEYSFYYFNVFTVAFTLVILAALLVVGRWLITNYRSYE